MLDCDESVRLFIDSGEYKKCNFLTPRQKFIIFLCMIEGNGYSASSRIINCTPPTIKINLRRALINIKKHQKRKIGITPQTLLKDYPFGERLKNAFGGYEKLIFFEDLFGFSVKELLSIRNLGWHSIKEIQTLLQEMGQSLRFDCGMPDKIKIVFGKERSCS